VRSIIVIPVRLAASRLPGKPLAELHGASMLARMIAIAHAAAAGPVLVAAADAALVEAAQAQGCAAVLTDPALPSGTDRVWAAARDVEADVIVNLQGDMPTLPPTQLRTVLDLLHATPEADIATLVSPSSDPAEAADPNIVKAVLARGPDPQRGQALYFTRAAAPHGPGPIARHIGVYAYRRAALERFVAAPPSPLEQRERLEQLRALEMGLRIWAAQVDVFAKGVDTPADLEAARLQLAGARP
jgi:3-deoxy-manno-octulosonate cytidylyltransferase (CMP-KDO synthetase)